MSTTQEQDKPQVPDPQQVAETFAEVAQRASKLITEHVHRQVKRGVTPPQDELGVAQAFMRCV